VADREIEAKKEAREARCCIEPMQCESCHLCEQSLRVSDYSAQGARDKEKRGDRIEGVLCGSEKHVITIVAQHAASPLES
jgi:hypothetical protein